MGLIRLLLALCVFFGHTTHFYNFIGGDTAVEGFYMISGFYMSLILRGAYANKPIWLFFRNRFLRIYPTYAFIALLAFLSVIFFQVGPLASMPAQHGWLLVYLVFTNIFVFGQDIVAFLSVKGGLHFGTGDPLYDYLLIRVAWSISVELWFYLLAPFLVKKSFWLIAAIMAASLALRFFLYQKGFDQDPWTYRFFPNELFFFLLGMLMQRYSWKPSYFALGLVIVLIMSGVPLFFFAALAGFLPRIFALTKSWAWDRFVGDLSYPFYLSHILFIDWNGTMHLGIPQFILIALILGFSSLIVLFIDRPIARWKHKS